jgi:hypothetical protein
MSEPTNAAAEAPVDDFCSLPKAAIIVICFSNSTNQVDMKACNDLRRFTLDATKQTEERDTHGSKQSWLRLG